MKTKQFKTCSENNKCGSALLLTVILTSLLAIVATLFTLASRINETTSSADTENKQLSHAAESVIELISHQLIDDLPDPNQEYYDYPDPCNAWLASLEPLWLGDNGTPADESDDTYVWQQISDVTGYLENIVRSGSTQDVEVKPMGIPYNPDVIREYPEIGLDTNNDLLEQSADADGDGVADSKWFELRDPNEEGITNSPKGKRIFAAVRVIDNSGMLNVNTAYQFDPASNDPCDIDGSSHTQIDLEALATLKDDNINNLSNQRIGSASVSSYRDKAIWELRNDDPCSTPFDIGDELELRYRYLIGSPTWSRLENTLQNTTMSSIAVPYDGSSSRGLSDWQKAATDPFTDPNDMRHLLTTYNLDRIIDPNLEKMVNINEAADTNNPRKIYDKLVSGLDDDIPSSEEKKLKAQYAQLAVNLADFADEDDTLAPIGTLDPNAVTVMTVNDVNVNVNYYGFEAQPFISEFGIDIAGNPRKGQSYYAVELYNPFSKRICLDEFAIVLVDRGVPPYEIIKNLEHNANTPYFINFNFAPIGNNCDYYINGTENAGTPDGGTFVLRNKTHFRIIDSDIHKVVEDSRFALFRNWLLPDKSKPVVDRRRTPDKRKPPVYRPWENQYDVYLARWVKDRWILVDYQPQPIQPIQSLKSYWGAAGNEVYPYRDVRYWHIAYPTMLDRDFPANAKGTLGLPNTPNQKYFDNRGHNFSFELPNPFKPERRFVTVGDVTRMLAIGNSVNKYTKTIKTIAGQLLSTKTDDEYNIRLDVQNPYNRNVFNYLTVFDPSEHINDPNETRIKGRININTAPWYVIAQLPWVSERNTAPFNTDNADRYDLAKAIVAYRDKLDIPDLSPVDYSDPDTGPKTGRYDEIKNVIDDRFNDANDIREKLGFEGIAELNFVLSGQEKPQNEQVRRRRMDYYDNDNQTLKDFPDLTIATTGLKDEIEDDFEERDVIFSRISNLVTVRSDLFTAYILVRLGTDGPQKRLIAILDRSGVTKDSNGKKEGKVKIRACQVVPDPR